MVVTLYPEDCQCRASSICYHVIAAKLSVGNPLAGNRKPLNMTALTKGTKKNVDKKSGRKKPRLNDLDTGTVTINPAPDSCLKKVSTLIACDIDDSICFGVTPISAKQEQTFSKPNLKTKSIIKTPGKKVKLAFQVEFPLDLPKTEEDPVIVSDELDGFDLYTHFNVFISK